MLGWCAVGCLGRVWAPSAPLGCVLRGGNHDARCGRLHAVSTSFIPSRPDSVTHGLCCAIGSLLDCSYILRLSRFNLYTATVATNLMLLGNEMGLAGAELPPAASQPPVIVVSNPGSMDASGNVVRDLMVARPAGDWSQLGGNTYCAPPSASAADFPVTSSAYVDPSVTTGSSVATATSSGDGGAAFSDVELGESEDSRLLGRQ